MESSMSDKVAEQIPIITPYPEEDTIPTNKPQPPPHSVVQNFPHPPPPPPKQHDALLALQRGGDLERRASRRFSTYQIKQQLGPSANGIPMIPPAQNTPVPNRGREVRESIQAVRRRGSTQLNRQRTERQLAGESSPVRNLSRFSEESVQSAKATDLQSPGSPTVKTPEDKLGSSYFDKDGTERPRISATLTGPIAEPTFDTQEDEKPVVPPQRQPSRKQQTPPLDTQFVPEESPQPGKPLTLFLQYKSKVKKIILEDGSNDLSIGRLQLAFIDKFAWNSHSDGIDLPEIYIQDSVSGVRYELEDLSDIKNNTVLVLNVEPLDEVKRHVDDGFSNIRRVVEGIKIAVEDQQSAIKLISDRQQETAKGLAGLSVAPQINGVRSPVIEALGRSASPTKTTANVDVNQLIELQTLRRDLAVMRQTYSSFASDVEASMAAVRTKASAVKSVAIKVALPDIKGESGRAYVNKELYETLPKDSSAIIEFVDDVQDSIEDLRKDVVTRGVRPLPRQLEQMAKDLSHATAEVKRLEAYINKEKPIWTKIWKQELQQVCDDKEALADAEALVADMKYDLDVVENTFKLVEEACKQQNLEASRDGDAKTSRNVSGAKMAAFALDQGVDPRKAKDGVLGEVKALSIDHDSRLDAIQRAERARKKELESRNEGAFKKELTGFVEENKLKKTGGVEEAERLRKMKDERNRKENYERAAARAAAAAERAKLKANGPPSTADGASNSNNESKPSGNLEPLAEGKEGESAEIGIVDGK
jgi:lysozyme family protein